MGRSASGNQFGSTPGNETFGPPKTAAQTAALFYRDWPQFDRGLPIRATTAIQAVDIEGIRARIAAVLQKAGFELLQNDPPVTPNPLFYRGPPGPLGLLIGERGLNFNRARRLQGNLALSILIPVGLILLSFAVVFEYPTGPVFLPLGVSGGFVIIGALSLGQRRDSFESDAVYVYYNARGPPSPALLREDVQRASTGSWFAVSVTAGRILTQNERIGKLGSGRSFKAVLPGGDQLEGVVSMMTQSLNGMGMA